MRAVRCVQDHVDVVEVARPEGDGVRVRIRSAGICGSDLHLVQGGFGVPVTLGHELAGELDDGRAVAIEPIVPCGGCRSCRIGDYNLCHSAPAMVMGVLRDGGMADELLVPKRCLVPLPAGVPVRDACLIEPLAVAVHGLRKAGLQGGQRVGIVGGGNIGLCVAAVARAAGADVGLVARHPAQIAAGEQLGALAAEGEYDIVVDAAGTASALERAVELCRPSAILVLMASYWEGLQLPAFLVLMKETHIIPSVMYGRHAAGRDIDAAAAILAANPAIAATLITHRLPLDAAAEAFRVAADRKAGAIKVVLEP
jgi:threonine dehydrogenase-like Zn-dependent dehydrogenase